MDKMAEFNELFRTRLEEGPEGIKVAEAAGKKYIKTRLREEAFSRKILPPEIVTKGELQRNESDDGLYKLIDIEPDSSAFALNFRAEAPAEYVTGSRFKVNFYKIESQRFEKQEAELLAHEAPITKILETNSVFDIQTVEDQTFYAAMVASVTGSTRDSVSTDVTITRPNLASSFKLLLANKLKAHAMLMTEELFADVEGWDADTVGAELAGKITVSGYGEPTLLKKKIIVTNKADIVNNRELWLFTKPEYMGKFFILEETKFWINKVADMIEWKSWEYVGAGIGNANSFARLTYTG